MSHYLTTDNEGEILLTWQKRDEDHIILILIMFFFGPFFLARSYRAALSLTDMQSFNAGSNTVPGKNCLGPLPI